MKRGDRYFLIGSLPDRLSEPYRMDTSDEWQSWTRDHFYCPGKFMGDTGCGRGRKELQIAPIPLEPTVSGNERGFHFVLDCPVVHLFRDDAREFFAPYLPSSGVWGRVWRDKNGERVPTSFSTFQIPWTEAVDVNRGKTPFSPKLCPACGRAEGITNQSRHMGILRWQLRDRPVVIDEKSNVCVHPDFYHDMKLKELFPDIKIVHKVKIYERDPHGWVLPGDPDWDGVFRKPPGWVDLPEVPPFDEVEFMRQAMEEQRLKKLERDQREGKNPE